MFFFSGSEGLTGGRADGRTLEISGKIVFPADFSAKIPRSGNFQKFPEISRNFSCSGKMVSEVREYLENARGQRSKAVRQKSGYKLYTLTFVQTSFSLMMFARVVPPESK